MHLHGHRLHWVKWPVWKCKDDLTIWILLGYKSQQALKSYSPNQWSTVINVSLLHLAEQCAGLSSRYCCILYQYMQCMHLMKWLQLNWIQFCLLLIWANRASQMHGLTFRIHTTDELQNGAIGLQVAKGSLFKNAQVYKKKLIICILEQSKTKITNSINSLPPQLRLTYADIHSEPRWEMSLQPCTS